jgi:hypothetical protein
LTEAGTIPYVFPTWRRVAEAFSSIFPGGYIVAEKAKTAQKSDALRSKRFCPVCGGESKVVQFTGFGPKGFFWVCDKNPEHVTRTR